MSYFTYLWKNETWARKTALALAGHPKLDYAAGDRFTRAGIAPGSVVFIVTVFQGNLYLGGYINVARVLDRAGAASYLGQPEDGLWQGTEYLIAAAGTEIGFKNDLLVPIGIASKIEFEKNGGFVNPKLDADGRIDRQTLRNV